MAKYPCTNRATNKYVEYANSDVFGTMYAGSGKAKHNSIRRKKLIKTK